MECLRFHCEWDCLSLLYSLQNEVISAPDAWIWCICFLFQVCTSPEFSQISTSTVHAELNIRQLFKSLMFVIILKPSFFSLAIPMVSPLGKKQFKSKLYWDPPCSSSLWHNTQIEQSFIYLSSSLKWSPR